MYKAMSTLTAVENFTEAHRIAVGTGSAKDPDAILSEWREALPQEEDPTPKYSRESYQIAMAQMGFGFVAAEE